METVSQDFDVMNEQGKSILIVEDEKGIRNSLRTILEDEGYDVFTASNGREAYEALSSIPKPSLILLDLMMPDMNGWEFCETLDKDEYYSTIPIMVLTAFADKAKTRGIKCKEIMRKPIDIDVLLGRVNHYFVASQLGEC